MLNKNDVLNFKKQIILGANVKLVPFSEKHLNDPKYLVWLHDYDVIKYLNLPAYIEKPVSFEELETYVKNLLSSESIFFYAAETIWGQFIGTFKIGPIDWYAKNANLGIMVGDKDFWGKRLAKEMFAIAIEFCFGSLNMHKVYGGCMEPNIGMRKVFEKLGFKEEGCFRKKDFLEDKYWNHYHYGLFKEEFITPSILKIKNRGPPPP